MRSAALESVCRLGMQCQMFATQSLDFLVDMFNDEIQSVRLCAINCLRRVSTTMHLREDQLETVLSVLEVCVCVCMRMCTCICAYLGEGRRRVQIVT